jgi:hypothetical protein
MVHTSPIKVILLSLTLLLLIGCKEHQMPTANNDANETSDTIENTDTNTTVESNESNTSTTLPHEIPALDTNITIQNNENNTTPTSSSVDENISKTDQNSSINKTLEFSIDAGEDKRARKGELVTLVAKVEGEYSNLTYRWLENESQLGSEQYLAKNDWSVGRHTITLDVRDDKGNHLRDEVTVDIENRLIIEGVTFEELNNWQGYITIFQLTPNEKSGTFEYLAYECGGDLIYISELNSGYLFDEALRYGESNCDAGCQIWLNHDGSQYKKYCNDELIVQGKLSTPLGIELYKKFPIEDASAGMDHNETHILYATQKGELYALDLNESNSTLIASLTQNYLVNGLDYFEKQIYYYSYTVPFSASLPSSYSMERVDLNTTITQTLTSTPFPDGLDIYQNKIYSVTNDLSGVLTIFDINGSYLDQLDTGIDDIVGISHTEYFFYILSEDGDIYQTNPTTGESKRIFNNDNLFEKGNNDKGLEAITVFNNYVYISYINDSSIYRIDVNLSNYE